MIKDCSNCFYAKWNKKDNGKINWKLGGDCTYQIDIPLCFSNFYGELPRKRSIRKNFRQFSSDQFIDCLCWKKLEKVEE